MKFVSVKNDVAFRKIFGNENKTIILISFLNAVMKLEGDRRITFVEMRDPFQLPIIRNLKASIIDVRAKDANGNTYIIEMQVSEPEGLDKRLLYYTSKDYSQQISSGEAYTQLRPVIFIGIFDFAFTRGTKYLAHHAVCDVEDGERVIKDMDFYFVELPKFQKEAGALENITDKWIYFLKEAENLEVVPANINDDGLSEAYNHANLHSWNKEELEAYDYAAMREQDERGIKALAERRAEEKGREEILSELLMEMHLEGLALEKIAKIAKINVEAVKQILLSKGLST